jgi:hypothetical protein
VIGHEPVQLVLLLMSGCWYGVVTCEGLLSNSC